MVCCLLPMHCSPCSDPPGARARSSPYRSPCSGSSGARVSTMNNARMTSRIPAIRGKAFSRGASFFVPFSLWRRLLKPWQWRPFSGSVSAEGAATPAWRPKAKWATRHILHCTEFRSVLRLRLVSFFSLVSKLAGPAPRSCSPLPAPAPRSCSPLLLQRGETPESLILSVLPILLAA
jgi:hypothetical protein